MSNYDVIPLLIAVMKTVYGVLLVTSSSYFLTHSILRSPSKLRFFIDWFTICITIIIAIQTILLWLSHYYDYWLLILLTVLWVLSFANYNLKRRDDQKVLIGNSQLFIGNLPFIVIPCFAILFSRVIKNAINLYASGDAFAYHIPMAAQWIQQHTIFARDVRVWYYPGNGELMLAFFLLPFKNDYLIFIFDALIWIVITLVFYAILRNLRIGNDTSLIGAMLFTTSPIITRAIGSVGTDLFLLMCFLMGLFYVLEVPKSGKPGYEIFLFLVSITLLTGTKYTGIFYAAALCLFAIFWWRSINFPVLAKLFLIFIPIFFLLGGGYYLRNVILTGNPIYPQGLSLGFEIFPEGDFGSLVATSQEISRNFIASSAILTSKPLIQSLYYLVWNTFRLAWSIPIILILGIVRLVYRNKNRSIDFHLLISMLVLLLISGVVFLTAPLVAENIPNTLNQIRRGSSLRIGLPAYALLMIIGIYLINFVRRANLILSLILLTNYAVFCYQLFINQETRTLIFFIVISIVMLFLLVLINRLKSMPYNFPPTYKYWLLFGTIIISTVGFYLATIFLLPRRLEQRYNLFSYNGRTQVIRWLDEQDAPATYLTSIGIWIYPFYGTAMQNRVVALGLSQSTEKWSSLINTIDPDYVVVSREHMDIESPSFNSFPQQEEILISNPDKFSLVYSDDYVNIYNVK